jgi:hypothetical protein
MQLSKPPKPKATRKRLKKEILSDDFKKRTIFWKKYCGKFSVLENFLWKVFHLTSLLVAPFITSLQQNATPISATAAFNVLAPYCKTKSSNVM